MGSWNSSKFTRRYDLPSTASLRTEIAKVLIGAMREQDVRAKSLAYDTYVSLGLSSPMSAQCQLSAFRNAYATSIRDKEDPNKSRKASFNGRELEKLAVVFAALSIETNHPIIERIKEQYKSFNYVPISKKEVSDF